MKNQQPARIVVIADDLVDLAGASLGALRAAYPDAEIIAAATVETERTLRRSGFPQVATFGITGPRRTGRAALLDELAPDLLVLIGERSLFSVPAAFLFTRRPRIVVTGAGGFEPFTWWSRAAGCLLRATLLDALLLAALPFLWMGIAGRLLWEELRACAAPPEPVSGFATTPPERPGLSIIIPNWNGARLGVLEPCLRSLAAVPGVPEGDIQVVVADDGSDDESLDLCRRHLWVTVAASVENRGFIAAANLGAEHSTGSYLLFLNNDMEVEPHAIESLLAEVRGSSAVAAAPRLYSRDGQTVQWGLTMGGILEDHLYFWNELENRLDGLVEIPLPAAYAVGGCLLVRREWFRRLGGFDRLYEPHTWEDIDLSYGIWKLGGQVRYVPGEGVRHRGHASIGVREGRDRMARLHVRNQYLFFWKNVGDRDLVLRHLLKFPRQVASRIVAGDRNYALGAFGAWRRIGPAMSARRIMRALSRHSDRSVLRQSRMPYEHRAAKQMERLPILVLTDDLNRFGVTGGAESRLWDALLERLDPHLAGFIRNGAWQAPAHLIDRITALPMPNRADGYHPLALLPPRALRRFSTAFDDRLKTVCQQMQPATTVIHGLSMALYAYHAGNTPVTVVVPLDDPLLPHLLAGTRQVRLERFFSTVQARRMRFLVAHPGAAARLRNMLPGSEVVSLPDASAERVAREVLVQLARARNVKMEKGYLS
ncbi:glycosyltransferase family 2 protein [bacterium]|nr:glycosyltransferase family 2 protein [candidate division CSSED10-310 bacterium]